MRATETLLLGRQFLYGLLHLLTGEEPSQERLSVVFSEATEEALALFGLDETPEGTAALKELQTAATGFAHQPDTMTEELRGIYTQLFIGPLDLKAPPWESVYQDGQRLIFTETTLAVRSAYRSEGFLPAQYPHVADDHISLELDFMQQLCIRSLEALHKADKQEYARLLKTQQGFLAGHLLRWVPRYAADLAEAAAALAGSSLYQAMAVLLHTFLAIDLRTLAELERAST
jgi:TorA maturation chaperone TorD